MRSANLSPTKVRFSRFWSSPNWPRSTVCGKSFQEPGDIALGGVEGSGLAEFGEEAEQIQLLRAGQGIHQAGRHEGIAQGAGLDIVLGDRDFLVNLRLRKTNCSLFSRTRIPENSSPSFVSIRMEW